MYQARGCMGKQRKYRPSPGTHFSLVHHTSFALHHTNIQALCFHAGLTITEVNKRRFCFFFSSLSSPPPSCVQQIGFEQKRCRSSGCWVHAAEREKSLRQLVLLLPGSPLAWGRIPISSFSLCSPFCPFRLHLWRCSWAVSSLLNSAVWFYCNSDLHLFVCVLFFFVLFYNLDSKLAEDFVSCNLFKVLCKAVKW